MRSRLVALLMSVVLTEPIVARGEPPEHEHEENLSTQPLFQAGAATFVVSYGASVGVAGASLERDDRGLYVPIAGPWIALVAHTPCEGACRHTTRDDALLALDGVAQAAGVAMIVAGVIADRRERAERRGPHLAVAPTYVGVFGRF